MNQPIPSQPEDKFQFRRNFLGFLAIWIGTILILWTALRIVIYVKFGPRDVSLLEILHAFATGFQRDLFMAAMATLPLAMWSIIAPGRLWTSRFHRWLFTGASWFLMFCLIFSLFTSYYFFEEFRSSFNTVAVDYLLFPTEVAVNIWESYHAGIITALCAIAAAGWCFLAYPAMRRLLATRPSSRGGIALGVVCCAAVLVLATSHEIDAPRVSQNRTLNEVANNEGVAFVAAFWTHQLDYTAFYRHLDLDAAYKRTRQILAQDNATFTEEGHSIRRHIAGDPAKPKLNVVVMLEESLGSEFWGSLGQKNGCTPQMDKLARDQGILFTHLFASGNRTVRGMEGVLSSFPPLPGDSIVRRPLSDNVESLARVLRRDGYTNIFLYGGRGIFDSMRSYAMRNGYDRFIEQKDFSKPTFTTAWGVCDEDLFDRGIQELRALSSMGKPFFATFLSTSNHKPYTYPTGRIPEDPRQKRRENAVKYSDYALGRFFEQASKEAFWTNTIFAVIADHGARVYGKQTIPIHSYEIPLVLLGPAVVKQPARIDRVGGSMDVGPTLLAMIGRPYESLFFGRDLLSTNEPEPFAVLNHNRDIGMLKDDRMAVLGLMGTLEFYEGDPHTEEMAPPPAPNQEDQDLATDCMALYQVADDLYMHQRYHLDQTEPHK